MKLPTRMRSYIRKHWEPLGILMIGLGVGYFSLSLLMWHGWIWISLKPPYSIFTFETLTTAQLTQMLWLNDVAFALFVLSIIIAVAGFVVFVFGEEVSDVS